MSLFFVYASLSRVPRILEMSKVLSFSLISKIGSSLAWTARETSSLIGIFEDLAEIKKAF